LNKRKNKKSKSISNIIAPAVFILGLLAIFLIVKTQFKKDTPNNFRTLPDSFMSYGIDISHYQGNINWNTVIDGDSSIAFVYCKVTEGLKLVDDQWKQNRKTLKGLAAPHGGYHFFRPNLSAKDQAAHFLMHYKSIQSDLPPVLDIETNEVSKAEIIATMKVWLNAVEKKTGKRPVIYTSYHMYSTFLKEAFKEYKFWVANYTYIPSRFEDNQIIHWQYTDEGTVNGISGNVDVNFSKIEF